MNNHQIKDEENNSRKNTFLINGNNNQSKDKKENKRNQSNDKKENQSKDKRKKTRNLLVAGTVILGILLTYFISMSYLESFLKQYSDDMISGISATRHQYEELTKKQELYEESMEEEAADLAGFASFAFEKKGYTKTTRDNVLSDIMNYCYMFYFQGSIDTENQTVDGYVYRDARNIKFDELSDEVLYKLLSTGSLIIGNEHFSASPVGSDGYVILKWGISDIIAKQSILSVYSSNNEETIMRVNTLNCCIEDSTEPDLIGKKSNVVISRETLRALNPGEPEFIKDKNGHYILAIADRERDDIIICSYVEMSKMIPSLLRSIVMPVFLGLLFMIFILVYILKFINKNDETITDQGSNAETKAEKIAEEQNNIEYIRVVGKYYLDKRFVSHISAIVLWAVCLIMISLVYVQMLIGFSSQNMEAMVNLSGLDSLIEMNQKSYEDMELDYEATRTISVDCIAQFFMRNPELLTQENIDRLCSKMPHTDAIAIFNQKGVAEYDTEGLVGYTLSTDERASEYPCQEVLNGISEKSHYANFSSNNYYIIGRRQDKDGLVRIKTDAGKLLDEFKELSSSEETIAVAYFGSAAKAYIIKDNMDKLYWYEPGASSKDELINTLESNVLASNFCGVTRIEGKLYYVNTLESSNQDYILLSIKDVHELGGVFTYFVFIAVLVIFIIQHLMIIAFGIVKLDKAPEKKVKIGRNAISARTFEERMMDESFMKVIRDMFAITCATVVALLLIDSLFGRTSLLSYLFGSYWERNFNLFSITMILLMTAGAIVAGAILQAMVVFFTKNMGPRGVTIGRLLSSIIRFLILIIVIAIVLINLGVKTSTLIAGVGIFGAVISFCAQQTVNDFLCGFFIVFDGLFNIGDWITVGDFRGQVIEIGIRTTQIARGGNIQIINNSELKKVMLMSENRTGAVCEIDIAYKEDINKVIELIEKNRSRYILEQPEIMDGPYVDGVTNLGESGVSITMWALSDQENVCAVERSILRITKNIFDENGIEIPFNQITIHKAED